MKLSTHFISIIVGLTEAQITGKQWGSILDPRIPMDCPVRKPPTGQDQAIMMLEALGGPMVGREDVPQNGKVASGSGQVKGRRCVPLDGLNCGLVTPKNYAKTDGTYGTGLYKAWYTTDPALPKHTIYMPKQTPVGIKLPVIVFTDASPVPGALAFPMLVEWASHGFMVIATGRDDGKARGYVLPSWIEDAVTFATKNAGTQNYTQIDSSRIGLAGLGEGGALVQKFGRDSRVTSMALLNAGSGMPGQWQDSKPPKPNKPTAFFIGGSTDQASVFAERTFDDYPNGTPKWKGNLDSGALGTYCQAHGGQYGIASGNWFRWTLRGDPKAGEFFTGPGAADDGWRTFAGDLDLIKPPIPLSGRRFRA